MDRTNQVTVNELANKFLGKNLNDYQTEYNPDILVPIERKLNREDYGISEDDFVGFDIWHNYECSFITNKGYPISLVGKIKIPANSPYFIESKSMKLYFFSFNMTPMGENIEEATLNFVQTVKRDLSAKTGSDVEFEVFSANTGGAIFRDYHDVEDFIDVEKLEFNVYKEDPSVLERSPGLNEVKVFFKNVRSNCRVTHQPDFATLFLHMKGDQPTLESVLKYVVSFRNEYHFHEEVTEQIFNNIKTKFNIEELGVFMLFTRRGGLDICPCRATHEHIFDKKFQRVDRLPPATVYQ